MFSAGNLVVMLNIKTKQQKYLKTLSGGAVGAITVIEWIFNFLIELNILP